MMRKSGTGVVWMCGGLVLQVIGGNEERKMVDGICWVMSEDDERSKD